MTLWMAKNRDVREISQEQDSHGNAYATPTEINNTFVIHLCQKFGPIDADNALSTILNFITLCVQ